MSIRQACRTLSLSRTVYFYQPDTRRDEPVIQVLTELAERYPRYGFKKLFQLLRRQGNTWNHKRVHRIYCLLKLNFRRKGKQRLPARNPTPLATPEALNQSWSIDSEVSGLSFIKQRGHSVMKKTRYTEEQIAFALKQAETGTRVEEVCRKMGISEATFYNWKKKFGGMGVTELRRLRQLEDENQRLRRLVADLSLDKEMLQDVIRKKF
ncbi:hypothetical protein GVv1_47260 (plasmid) [Enterobacter pseudoroggenkampii]